MLADGTEAAWRAGDLIEQHLVPTLAGSPWPLKSAASRRAAQSSSSGGFGAQSLRSELAAARSAGRAGRVIELRDALTQHLRGEPLHALDREIALGC